MLWDSKMQFRRQVESKLTKPPNQNPAELKEDTSKTEETHQKTVNSLDTDREEDSEEPPDNHILSNVFSTVDDNKNQDAEGVKDSKKSPDLTLLPDDLNFLHRVSGDEIFSSDTISQEECEGNYTVNTENPGTFFHTRLVSVPLW